MLRNVGGVSIHVDALCFACLLPLVVYGAKSRLCVPCICVTAGARPLTLAFVQRQEKPLDNALGAADLTGVDALAQVRAEAAAAVNAPLDVESDELLPPTVLKAQDEASKAERERLEAEAEVAALQAELEAAEEMLRVKREAKKRHDEQVELARAAAENSP